MDRIKITGGERLSGTIAISGAKNAALPLMIASLLTSDTLTLKNVPNLADVFLLGRIFVFCPSTGVEFCVLSFYWGAFLCFVLLLGWIFMFCPSAGVDFCVLSFCWGGCFCFVLLLGWIFG